MHQLVPLEIARCGEELATVLAAVARLARVPLLVQVQQADEPVALAALLAAIGLQRAGGRARRRRVAGGARRGSRVGQAKQGGGRGAYLCVFSWALQAAGSEKALLHSRHENGFSPVWMRMCRLKFPVCVNSFPQSCGGRGRSQGRGGAGRGPGRGRHRPRRTSHLWMTEP